MDLVAMLPWWAGVGLAVVSFLYFHGVAGRPLPSPGGPGQLGAAMGATLWFALAQALQYVVPLLCLAGAGLSAHRRHERSKLLADATNSDTALAVDRMSWQQFELLVGEAFRQQGYAVAELGGNGPDGGVDLVLTKEGQRYLVQCKQWRAFKVGVTVIRELYGVMAARHAAGGFVVTSGRFTGEARAFAAGKNIDLIDGLRLGSFLKAAAKLSASAEVSRKPSQATSNPGQSDGARGAGRTSAEQVPSCPSCNQAMVRRMARQGAYSGQAFWGCVGYPGCRGTRPIER